MRVARDVVRFKRDGGLAISAGVMTFGEMPEFAPTTNSLLKLTASFFDGSSKSELIWTIAYWLQAEMRRFIIL
jgi:hypothetical protein